jgi:hypothetical protein
MPGRSLIKNFLGRTVTNGVLLAPFLITGVLVLAVLVATAIFFMRIPVTGTTLAMDWIGIRAGVAGWNVIYGGQSTLQIPPWCALLLIPIGLLPLQAGWGVVAFLTFVTVPLSLPWDRLRGWRIVVAAIVLALGFPVLRTIVDGNVEFLVVAGLLLLEAGILHRQPVLFAIGILLSATKVQETWILMLFLPLLAAKAWTARKWLQAAGVVAVVSLPAVLWKGRDWLLVVLGTPDRGNIMNSSLMNSMRRFGLSGGAVFLVWAILFLLTVFVAVKYCQGYSREGVAFFLSASLLLAPYAAGNNLLVVYVFGAMPLLLARRWEGAVLFALINLVFLFLPFRDLLYWWSAPYWTMVLVISWILFALRVRALSRAADFGGGKLDSTGLPFDPENKRAAIP